MSSIRLQINSLTHHDVAARREEFVSTAVGRTVALVAMPFVGDQWCVAVYVGPLRIGNIVSGEAMLAQRMLLAACDEVVTGRIVEVIEGGFRLLADMGERPLASEEEVERARPLGLGGWQTSVAALSPDVERTQRAVVLMKLLWTYLRIDAEAAAETAEALFGVMRYDLSGDMQRERRLLCQALLERGDERLTAAARRLEEAAQRMGGDHHMAEVAAWLRTELPSSPEADGVLTQTPPAVTRRQVVAEAEALPCGLYRLWQTDATQFARVLYGMRLSRTDIHRVLGCLIWLERMPEEAEQAASTKDSVKIKDLVAGIKDYYMHDRKGANDMRNIMGNMGQQEAKEELDEWIQAKEAINMGLTDAQVAKAIEAICGEGRALDKKQKWAGVYWCLRWHCNYPVKGSDFCDRIACLPFSKTLNPECCYDNIRKLVTLSFMAQDARQLDSVKPSRGNEATLAECRAVVQALAQELEKVRTA